MKSSARTVVTLALVGLCVTSVSLHAQTSAGGVASDTVHEPVRPPHYWRDFTAGFAASLLAHESAHIITAYAVGSHPWIGFDKGRPTVYSGLNAVREPRKQFLFSSMGPNVQAALDEGILDAPHERSAAFERGMLASGLATAVFYVTLGRTAAVSDVDFMARTSSLSKTDITYIYGGIAAVHPSCVQPVAHAAALFTS